jgi:hypothetical protein
LRVVERTRVAVSRSPVRFSHEAREFDASHVDATIVDAFSRSHTPREIFFDSIRTPVRASWGGNTRRGQPWMTNETFRAGQTTHPLWTARGKMQREVVRVCPPGRARRRWFDDTGPGWRPGQR